MFAYPKTQSIDFIHAQIHAANYWTVSHVFLGVPNAGNFDLLILCGAREVHCVASVALAASCRAQIFEAPTINANGTALTCFNHHRITPVAPLTTAFFTPTIGATGTQLLDRFIPSVGTGANAASTLRGNAEWNFAPNVAYLLRGVNVGGAGAADGESIFEFYEVVK